MSSSFGRAGSIHLRGKENMHTELRVRTVCELTIHETHYLRPEVVAFCGGFVDDGGRRRQLSNARLHATSANLEAASSRTLPLDSTIARETIILDCLETTK